MANLTMRKKVKYTPNLPGNLELPEAERFHLWVTAGLSVLQYQAITKAFAGVDLSDGGEVKNLEPLLEALDGVVSLGDVKLTIEGVDVPDLLSYLKLMATQNGWFFWFDLMGKLAELNSVSGTKALFSERPSGGTAGTAAPT